MQPQHSGRTWDFAFPWMNGSHKCSVCAWERKGKDASEPDFMGLGFMGHPGFLKLFHALNASPLELCLKSQQADDARGMSVPHEQAASPTARADPKKCNYSHLESGLMYKRDHLRSWGDKRDVVAHQGDINSCDRTKNTTAEPASVRADLPFTSKQLPR